MTYKTLRRKLTRAGWRACTPAGLEHKETGKIIYPFNWTAERGENWQRWLEEGLPSKEIETMKTEDLIAQNNTSIPDDYKSQLQELQAVTLLVAPNEQGYIDPAMVPAALAEFYTAMTALIELVGASPTPAGVLEKATKEIKETRKEIAIEQETSRDLAIIISEISQAARQAISANSNGIVTRGLEEALSGIEAK